MSKRKSLSKKIRFEVFKRDKFKCQYCGVSAPDVVLNVDHIDPVANGGSNEIVNLITSCFDCNQGKKARLLSDDTVVKKQKRQLEIIQERREQLELMLEWKKSLNNFEDEKTTMISDYWSSMMAPFSLNENGIKSLEILIKKFQIEDILESIDIATKKYVKFDEDGNVTKESVEEAFNKIGGICTIKNMSEVKQKMAYVKGICRNRFSYWDNRKGSIILNNYVTALKNQGWDDDRLINDLEEEVIPKAKKAKNWTEWRSILEGWTNDINNWNNDQPNEVKKEYSLETLDSFSSQNVGEINDTINVLCHLGSLFPNFTKSKFINNVFEECLNLLERSETTIEFVANCKSIDHFNIPGDNFDKLGECLVAQPICEDLLTGIFKSINLTESRYSDKDKLLMKNILENKIKRYLTIDKK